MANAKGLYFATTTLENLKNYPVETFIDGLTDKEFAVTNKGVRLRNPRDKLTKAFEEAGYRIINVRAEKEAPADTAKAVPPRVVKRVLKKPADPEITRLAQAAGE